MVVLSGASGAGKDTALRGLRERGVRGHYVVTTTTRPPRRGERDGVDYRFIDEPSFMGMIERGELLEHALVYGRHYGIPRQPLVEALRRGEDILMRIDVQGAATIKALVPDAVTIFVIAPDDLGEARLRVRNTEDDAELRRRLDIAGDELSRLPEFDYVVRNEEGRLDEAVETIVAIMRAERCRVGRRPPIIP